MCSRVQKIHHSKNTESETVTPGMELFLRSSPRVEPVIDSLIRVCVASLDVIELPLRPHAPQRLDLSRVEMYTCAAYMTGVNVSVRACVCV